MPLPRNVYDADVLVDGQVVEHRRIVLCHGDELRAELEANKRALPITLSLTLTSLMLWAACVRLGHFAGSYDEWRNGGLIEYRRVPAEELVDQPATTVAPNPTGTLAATVDPTPEAGPSGPVSPSPLTSPESTGSPASPSTTA